MSRRWLRVRVPSASLRTIKASSSRTGPSSFFNGRGLLRFSTDGAFFVFQQFPPGTWGLIIPGSCGSYAVGVPIRRNDDEGPSEDDIERFGDDSPVADARCPDCGASVWSEADVCPKCFSYLAGSAPAAPQGGMFAKHWKAIIIWALIIATLTLAGIPVLQALLRL